MKKLARFALVLVVYGQVALAQTGRIVYINLDGQVATVQPDGSEERVLTAGAQRFQFPAWSPDGLHLAVLGADTDGGFLSVLEDVEAAAPKELYRSSSEPPFYLYWAPDGETIGFLANTAAGIGLNIVPTTGAGAKLLATGSPFYWQWTSDGQGLFIHANADTDAARLGFTSRVRDTLAENLAPPGRFQAPGISPSGRYIAYGTTAAGRGASVVVQGRPGSSIDVNREVAHSGFASLSWSPTADELAIMSPAENVPSTFGPVQLLDAETGLLEPLTDNAAVAFFWSPDGRYLAYFAPHRRGEGELAGAAAPAERLVAQRPQGQTLLLDLYLVDVALKSERLLTTFAPSPQFVAQFLPFFDQYALSHSLWSPASDALVLSIIDLEASTLRVVVLSLDGAATPVGEGDMAFWSR
ncbi:PD40 domain-containing protein [soil metagenome]